MKHPLKALSLAVFVCFSVAYAAEGVPETQNGKAIRDMLADVTDATRVQTAQNAQSQEIIGLGIQKAKIEELSIKQGVEQAHEVKKIVEEHTIGEGISQSLSCAMVSENRSQRTKENVTASAAETMLNEKVKAPTLNSAQKLMERHVRHKALYCGQAEVKAGACLFSPMNMPLADTDFANISNYKTMIGDEQQAAEDFIKHIADPVSNTPAKCETAMCRGLKASEAEYNSYVNGVQDFFIKAMVRRMNVDTPVRQLKIRAIQQDPEKLSGDNWKLSDGTMHPDGQTVTQGGDVQAGTVVTGNAPSAGDTNITNTPTSNVPFGESRGEKYEKVLIDTKYFPSNDYPILLKNDGDGKGEYFLAKINGGERRYYHYVIQTDGLVSTSQLKTQYLTITGGASTSKIKAEMVEPLKKLAEDFYTQFKTPFNVFSAYREAAYQKRNLAKHSAGRGSLYAEKAPVGGSKHHTGYAVDIFTTDRSFWTNGKGRDYLAWLKSNAPKYGIEMSYPRTPDPKDVYEQWEFVYTGSQAAREALTPIGSNKAPAQTASQKIFVIGDNLAVGFGNEISRIYKNKVIVNAKVGDNPEQVLKKIKSIKQDELRGQIVVLSTGAGNYPAMKQQIQEQFDYLSVLGAKVIVVGVVDNYKDNPTQAVAINDTLRAMASKKSFDFKGNLKGGTDKLQPSSYTINQLNLQTLVQG